MGRRKSETMAEEFTRLAMELAVLNPEKLHEIGDRMMASGKRQPRAK